MSRFLVNQEGKVLDACFETNEITEKHLKTFQKYEALHKEIEAEYQKAYRNTNCISLDLKYIPKYNECMLNTAEPYSVGYISRKPSALADDEIFYDLHWPREYKEDIAYIVKRHANWLQLFIDDYWTFAAYLYKSSQAVNYKVGSMLHPTWSKEVGLRAVECPGEHSDICKADMPYIWPDKNPFNGYMRKHETVTVRYIHLMSDNDLEGVFKKGIGDDVERMGTNFVVYNGILRPEDFWKYWIRCVYTAFDKQKEYITANMENTLSFKQCIAICNKGNWNLNKMLWDCYRYIFDDNQIMLMLGGVWENLRFSMKSWTAQRLWKETILGSRIEKTLNDLPKIRKFYDTPTVWDKDGDGFAKLMQYHYVLGFNLLNLGITREYVCTDPWDKHVYYDIQEFRRVFSDTVEYRVNTIKNMIYPIIQDIYKLRNIKLSKLQEQLLKM